MAGKTRSNKARPLTGMARSADRHALYERSVQQPEVAIGLMEHAYASLHDGALPQVLREDFCGTALLSSSWVASELNRRAVGIDLDPRVLAYARKTHLLPLGSHAKRLRLVEADVQSCGSRADVIASLNFSHCIYHERTNLVRYLRHARRCLYPGGLMVMDLYGGAGAFEPCLDERAFETFTYQWEQVSYEPVTARAVNHIHFTFPDGSRRSKAFQYDWALVDDPGVARCHG